MTSDKIPPRIALHRAVEADCRFFHGNLSMEPRHASVCDNCAAVSPWSMGTRGHVRIPELWLLRRRCACLRSYENADRQARERSQRRVWLECSLVGAAAPGRGSVRRGEHLRLHQLHRYAAALHGAVAGLDTEDLCLALLALESLSQLVGHRSDPPPYFSCICWPQQPSSPSPALVTIISELHLVHM